SGPNGSAPPDSARPYRSCRRLLLVHLDQVAQLGLFFVPAPAQLLQALEAGLAGGGVGSEASRVHPRGVAGTAELEGDDAAGGAGQQLPVMADVQQALAGLDEAVLQPALAGHVQE